MTITPGEEALAEVPFRVGDKTSLTAITTFTNDTTATAAYNQNNTTITAALDNALSRNGLMPNQMGGNIDMNSNHILNLPAPFSPDEPMRVVDMQSFTAGGSITFNNIPVGGAPGTVLTKNTFSDYDVSWSSGSIAGLPTGGSTNQVLAKNSNTSFDTVWNSSGLPTGGSMNQVLQKNSSANYDASWITISGSIPTGGTTGQVLVKNSNTNFDTTWNSSFVPTGGTVNQVLTKNSSTNYDTSWTSVTGTVPSGGTTGQVLAKNSNTNFDTLWVTEAPGQPAGGTTGQVLTKNSATNYDSSWQTVSGGGGGVTTGAGIVFADAVNNIFTNNQGVIAPGHGGVTGNGVANDTSFIQTIFNSYNEIHVTPGNYLINSASLSLGKILVVHAGAKFTITSASTFDLSGVQLTCPRNSQWLVTLGTGKVVGMEYSTPEMFGAVRDGTTDDRNAVYSAINAVAQSGFTGSAGRRPKCYLSAGTYFCASNINISLPNSGPRFTIEGAGYWTTASQLRFGTSATGSALQFFQTSGGNLSFELTNFQVVNKTAGSGCSIGIDMGWTGSGAAINTSDQPALIMIDHMWVSGFATNVRQIGLAGVQYQFCQFWGLDSTFSTSTTNANHVLLTISAPQVTFANFLENVFVQDNGSSSRSVYMNDAGVNAFSGISGCQFIGNIFYQGSGGASCIYMQSTGTNNAGIGDIWFMHNQFENQTGGGSASGTAIVAQATNGGLIYDIHIDHNYFGGQGWSTALFGQAVLSTASMSNFYVTNNFIANPFNGIYFQGTGATSGIIGTRGFIVSNNMFVAGINASNLVVFQNLDGDVVCSNNNTFVPFGGSRTISTGINFANAGANAVAIGNNTKSGTPISFGAWTNLQQANNI